MAVKDEARDLVGGGALGCPCGGMAYPKQSRCRNALLVWKECGSCGRCGRFALSVDGALVAEGPQAQARYEEIERC